MADFDVLVIGGGTGNNVAAAAADAGRETALVEPGPLGGTCLNRGCNPSKMLIQAANAANNVRNAHAFHVDATLSGVDHGAIVAETRDTLDSIAATMEDDYRERNNLTLFDEYTTFVDDRAVELGGETVTADRVVIATGSRPLVPPIDGLGETPHLTSRDVFQSTERPESLVILGGGYIAVELGYYYESVGTDVTIVEMEETLVPRESSAIAAAFTETAAERHEVLTSHRVTEVAAADGERRVCADGPDGERVVTGDELLVALGRRPNSDDLGLEQTAVETDDHGFVRTDAQLRTTADGVWAQGDVADNSMFKHTGDYETDHTITNVVHDEGVELDLTAEPHTIFTEPQIAGVGATEQELEANGTPFVTGRADYADSAMGRAKRLQHGFVQVLASPDGDILGCHAIGEEASALVHEAVVAMRHGLSVEDMGDTIHAHPTLNKIVESAFADVSV